jgi:hypothetical protein
MKKVRFLLAVVAVCITCELTQAQENADAENARYEQLKGLEPLVGTFRSAWTNDEDGMKVEMLSTTSWNRPQNMLMTESRIRRAGADADLSKQEWSVTEGRQYYVWNRNAQRIEQFRVQARNGVITISEVKPQGDGVFALSRVSTTGSGSGRADVNIKATDHGITWTITNRVNRDGEPQDDMEFTSQRVEHD